jgi:hypothetical protein
MRGGSRLRCEFLRLDAIVTIAISLAEERHRGLPFDGLLDFSPTQNRVVLASALGTCQKSGVALFRCDRRDLRAPPSSRTRSRSAALPFGVIRTRVPNAAESSRSNAPSMRVAGGRPRGGTFLAEARCSASRTDICRVWICSPREAALPDHRSTAGHAHDRRSSGRVRDPS